MVGVLNLYLDPELSYTWRNASIIVSKAQGHGVKHARNLRQWILNFVRYEKLPLHCYGQTRWSVLEDEDISQELQLKLTEKAKEGYIKAADLVDIVASQDMQAKFSSLGICKPKISERTARNWLHKLKWRYGRTRNGMYVDGHEREDVVEYRKAFVERWKEYEKRFHMWDNDGNPLPLPAGFPIHGGHFRLILVTHDESTFYQNDQRKSRWSHEAATATPQPKGDGQSIMVSDFLTVEWGHLVDGTDHSCIAVANFDGCMCSEARVLFKAGKNRDGYFDADDLCAQVDRAIDIFEAKTNGTAQGLFLFDNAPSHQKRADDALSARKMVKNPKNGWTHRKGGLPMRNGTNPNTGESQSFYFPDDHPDYPGWFKGMEQIIRERGLWPAGGLPAECPKFRCPENRTDCCCRRLLFNQPDFVAQKPQLQELIESRGHICDFYPKYHCELNFIEQYWGTGKLRFRVAGRANTLEEMEQKVTSCLDDVPLLQIRRYANRSARFIHAYGEGLTGAQAAWANRKYHSHRTLPPEMVALVKQSVLN
ncbi:hypothetical protein K474DRAFT_1609121 [Panus rudis PR-1116 ss-1]|nr:hypothetical protein K474DRAFT_1609121 [Panus rudis PR-1116 ss-1]